MDDGELDFSNQELFSSSNMVEMPSSGSVDNFVDELLKDMLTCTHTHTCNPPGPDLSHTHTCFHVHTKIVPAPNEDERVNNNNSAESTEKRTKKRPLGNREAVRKYREKKKAQAASLEDEVVKLSALNQQLLKRLQGQASLEAELARLRCLLVDIRGRIEGEIGSFPYQKTVQSVTNPNLPGAYVTNPCNLQCNDQIYCFCPGSEDHCAEGSGLNDRGFSGCDFENLNCLADFSSKEIPVCGVGGVASVVNSSVDNRRKGADHPATAASVSNFFLHCLYQKCAEAKVGFGLFILSNKQKVYSR
ncbi:hypothetical protein Nepgr_019701 [Nepenthes gracilis]|uniref:BZIP domain-containing protein n=1 Tax=Nepenthes gracilis TaxID=150966 RepID=A0AAD3SVI3_NEPGR|nr:hypothetical protein Nepgr_019701 [Nepenthes gracilis]